MVASRQNPATSLPKPSNTLAVRHTQAIARINSKQPELIEICGIKHAQQRIVAISIDFAIAGSDRVQSRAGFVSK